MHDARSSGRGRLLLSAVAAFGLVIGVAFPVAFTLQAGNEPYSELLRTFPGFFVALGTALLLGVNEFAAVLSAGALVSVLFLRDARPAKAREVAPGLDLRLLRAASLVWVFASGLLVLFQYFDTAGVALEQLGIPGTFDYVASAAYSPGSLWVRFAAALLVALVSLLAKRWTTLLVALWGSGLAILAPIVVGQVLVGPAHDHGGDAAVVQALVTYPLLGALATFAITFVAGQQIPARSWRRLGWLALVAVPVVVGTEAVVTSFKLAGSSLGESTTGAFIVARWVAFAAVLLALVWLLLARRRPLSGYPLGLALIGVAGWVSLSVAMTRQPPPQYFVPTTITETFLGFNVPDAPTIAGMFTMWRVNLLFAVLAAAGIAVYLVLLVTARRRGVAWPVMRTICWCLGWGVVFFMTSSGFGKYSAPHFGIHMIVHMSLNMLAPILLALGGVVTLALRAARPDPERAGLHQWVKWVMDWRLLRALYNPLIIFSLFIASYYLLYLSPLFETLMRFHWGHQLMNAHFLVVGYIYYSLIIGVDRAPRPLPHIGRLGLTMAAMPFHAFFGVILMNGGNIVAQDFYTVLDLPWADLAAAQELGGGVAWAGGELPALVVVVALGLQWAMQDKKEARRRDRHFDSGRDSEFDDYNQMLQRLAQRDGGGRTQPTTKERP